MTSKDVRDKYISFFKKAPRNHIEISPAPLVLEDDPTTLFTSAGMQPLVPFLKGESHPKGKRLVNSQPSIRMGDIEDVGDNRHITFFEMLGNWSLGDYFKEEQLPWIWEFLTEELGLSKERLWVSVFEGTKDVPKDKESAEIWKKIGISEKRIVYYSAKKNWWSMTGTPDEMKVGDIGGPDSEIFYDFGEELHVHEKSVFKNEKCHPNCDCGRFLEIGNSVFIQYKKLDGNKLEELSQKNVDFGGGFERITAATQNRNDIFTTDIYENAINQIENKFKVKYGKDEDSDKSIRIIADHMRASSASISSGIFPSNKMQGYILRRLVRRSVLHAKILSEGHDLTLPTIDFSKKGIPLVFKDSKEIQEVVDEEAEKFAKALERGTKQLLNKVKDNENISGSFIFDLYQTEGFPLEVSLEVLEKNNIQVSDAQKEEFRKEFEKHKKASRTSSAGVFKGGLADLSPEVIRLHSATHLLLASLRKVLGNHVAQKGQNITHERSRFDFPNPEKLSEEEIKKVEEMINDVIEKKLPVKYEVMSKENALKTGAIHAFNEKYTDTVKVYYVGENLVSAFSREFCGGPHVDNTGKIGRVKIKKQEKIGSGIVRIYLVLE